MARTKIEWTDDNARWNPVVGCTRASRGCDHCYAVVMSNRLEGMAKAKRAAGEDPGKLANYEGLTVLNNRGDRHFNGTVRTVEDALTIPLRWKKPRLCFVNSMSDLFHKDVPFEFIDRVFAVMALCPQHTFQILTKRPERMAEYLQTIADAGSNDDIFDHLAHVAATVLVGANGDPSRITRSHIDGNYSSFKSRQWPLPNVWLGTSVEDQPATERIGHLLRCDAAVRFLSCEPLLGAVDLPRDCFRHFISNEHFGRNSSLIQRTSRVPGYSEMPNPISWVIVGGESGKGARPCNIDWIRSIVRQCRNASVPVFVKQLGRYPTEADAVGGFGTDDPPAYSERELELEDLKGGVMEEWPADLRVREMPGVGR